MKITRISKSRIDDIDFDNLPFGKIFSDHMLICEYKDGHWSELQILPYGPINMNPGTQVLHYGQSVFEGMKAFKSNQKDVLIFRKHDNLKRLNKSAKRLSIPQIPEDKFMNGLDTLISLDSEWCKQREGYSLYIRPFIFASDECIKASSSVQFTFMIITSPSSQYYNEDLHLLVEKKYTRASRGGVGFTKAAGNYAASFYPTRLANSRGYNQVIWTDAIEHNYIEEAGTMNIWFRVNDVLITPELSDSILSGITRDSLIKLCHDSNLKVQERQVSIQDILDWSNSGDLIEIFGTGTAVAVSPIRSVTIDDNRIELDHVNPSFSLILKTQLQGIQTGVLKDKYRWVSKVS